MVRVCFVCLGNICRSPTAEGAFLHLVRQAGLEAHIAVESAGTSGYHVGDPRDARATRAARARGIPLVGVGRQLTKDDFRRCDYLLAMDHDNLSNMLKLAPASEKHKVRLLRSFDPSAPPDAEVPDPYYGGDQGFEDVLDMCLAACRGLLEHIRANDLARSE